MVPFLGATLALHHRLNSPPMEKKSLWLQ